MAEPVNLNVAKKGQLAVFRAFSDPTDTPEQADLLVPGESYPIVSFKRETSETEPNVNIAVANPNFDDTKKVSKKNPDVITFTVFEDEISEVRPAPEPAEEPAEQQEAAPAPKATTKKSAPKKAAPAKAAPPKKVAKKVATKPAETQETVAETTTTEPKQAAKKAAKKVATVKKAAPKKAVVKKAAPKKAATKATPPTPAPKAKSGELTYDEDKIIILAEEEEDQDILALVTDAPDLIDLAQEEIHDASLTEYKLGGVLYHVKKSGQWKDYENGSYDRKHGWADFVSDVLGMEYRKAMYLIDIYTKFNKYGIPASEAAKIGWTKSSVIAAAMTEENADSLLTSAKEETVSELKETVREIKKTEQRSVVKKITFKFRLTEDAAVSVRETLEQAKTALGDKDESDLFEHIVMEWAAEHLDVQATQKANRRVAKK